MQYDDPKTRQHSKAATTEAATSRASVQELTFPDLQLVPLNTEHILPNKKRSLLRNLKRLHQENPRTPLGLAGLRCCEGRTSLFGMNRSEFSRRTGITRDQLLKLESGKCSILGYETILKAFRSLRDELPKSEKLQAKRVTELVTTISRLLVVASPIRHPVNRLMLELSFRFGKDVFHTHSDFTVPSLRAREKKSGTGTPSGNYKVVWNLLSLATAENNSTQPPSKVDLLHTIWETSEIKRLVKYETSKRLTQLRQAQLNNPECAKKVATLLTVIAFGGRANHHSIHSEFGIPVERARCLTRGEFIETKYVEKIVEKLTEHDRISRYFANQLLEQWEDSAQTVLPKQENPLSKRIINGLHLNGLDTSRTAMLLKLESNSPGNKLRNIIAGLTLGTDLCSFHTIAHLASQSHLEAESLALQLIDWYEHLPKFTHHPLSEPYKSTVLHGLKNLKEFARKESLLDPNDKERTLGRITERIRRIGSIRTKLVLQKLINLEEPSTPAAVADALDFKRPCLKPYLAELKMAQPTLRSYQSGVAAPGLVRLKEMVKLAGVVPSKALYINWCLTTAKLVSGATDFGRGLRALIGEFDHSAKEMHRSLSEQRPSESNGVSLRQFQHLIQVLSEVDFVTLTTQRMREAERLLQIFINGGVPQPTVTYLRSCLTEQDSRSRISNWCHQMSTSDRLESTFTTETLRIAANEARTHRRLYSLEEAHLERMRIGSLARKDINLIIAKIEDDAIVKAFRFLPGASLDSLPPKLFEIY